MSLAIEEKYDQVRRLINMGKERGYLLYDEVNDMLPAEVHSLEEIDDLLSTFECYGIDVYEDVSSAKAARAAAESAEISDTKPKEEVTAEEVELDLTPGTMEKTNDPVRIYLREMGTVPLLTREGEVAIAKRIERGQMLVLKTISRSPIMLKEILAIGEELRECTRSIKEIVQFDEEDLTEEKTGGNDAAESADDRQDREAASSGAEASGEAGKYADVRQARACSSAAPACAHTDCVVASGSLDRFPRERERKRLIETAAAHGRAPAIAGAGSERGWRGAPMRRTERRRSTRAENSARAAPERKRSGNLSEVGAGSPPEARADADPSRRNRSGTG